MVGLRSPFVLSFVLAVAAVVATGAGGYWSARVVAESTQWVAHTHQVQAAIGHVLTLLQDTENGQRGYLLTGREDYLEPFRVARVSLPDGLDALEHLTRDNPSQQTRIAELRRLATERVQLSEEVVRRMEAGDPAAAHAIVLAGGGKRITDAARRTVAAMRMEEERLLEHRIAEAREAGRRSTATAGITTALVLALLTTVFLTARRAAERVRRSRESLDVTLRSIADGVIATDTGGRVRFMNPAAERMTGWTEDEARQRALEEVLLLPTADGSAARPLTAALLQGDGSAAPTQENALLRGRDGHEYVVALSAATIRNRNRPEGAVVTVSDQTARQQALRHLHQSEERYRLLVEGVKDYAIFLVDCDGTIASWNEGARRIEGYEPEEIVGRPLATLFTREDVAAGVPQAEMAHALAGEAYSAEGWRVRKDGSRFWASVLLTAVKDPDGTPRGFIQVTRDMSERRAVEQALRASESRYRTLTEALPHMVWTADASLALTYASCHWTAFTGREADLSRAEWLELVHPQDRDAFLAAIGPAQERGEAHEAEFRFRRQDGAWRRVLSRAMPRHDDSGALVQWVGTITDVHDRWEVAEALRQSQALTQHIIEGSSALVYAKDLKGRYFLSNRAWKQMLGVPPASTAVDDDVSLLGTTVAEAVRANDERVIRSGEAVMVEESVTLRGELRTFLSSKFPLRDAAGQVYAVCGVSTDVTELKRAQQEVLRLNSELEDRVARRTRQLADANQELEAFSYTVSHDLRAPLRGMQGFAQALDEDYGERLDDEGRGYLQRIIGAARRMESLIQDLLDYGRLSREELRLKDQQLGTALAEARERLASDLRQRGAVIEVATDLPAVRAHPPVLVQIIVNLLGNAIKFTAPGVVPHIRIAAERRGERVRTWVQDNGIGIRPEHRERIFNVFERLHGQESYPGTGVGLAIVRKGCERMDGSCGVEAAPGGGSRFWFELPAAKD